MSRGGPKVSQEAEFLDLTIHELEGFLSRIQSSVDPADFEIIQALVATVQNVQDQVSKKLKLSTCHVPMIISTRSRMALSAPLRVLVRPNRSETRAMRRWAFPVLRGSNPDNVAPVSDLPLACGLSSPARESSRWATRTSWRCWSTPSQWRPW